jgi:hypothetical protein
MKYNGTGKLAEAIAELFGLSIKSQARIAKLIKEAKIGLSIAGNAKILPNDVKLAIYRWHYDRLNPVQDVKQDDPVQDKPVQALPDAPIQNVKQTDNDALVLLSDNAVQNVKQVVLALESDDIDNPVYDFKQVHFAVTVRHNGEPRRTTVMLEGYLVKALQRKHGIASNPAIRAWIEQAINTDGVRFDHHAPLTRQVKRLIVESFV